MSSMEAAVRLERNGANPLPQKPPVPLRPRVLAQLAACANTGLQQRLHRALGGGRTPLVTYVVHGERDAATVPQMGMGDAATVRSPRDRRPR
ncbi:hypothetical protein ACIBO2_57050 [Nonomuraea sp. NPDC050022]|uniref:hypothetical protein n=1 Tax=Nonomuraea sp. NPDC050022 TaxID=3364358 RepID=UPI0037B92C3A